LVDALRIDVTDRNARARLLEEDGEASTYGADALDQDVKE